MYNLTKSNLQIFSKTSKFFQTYCEIVNHLVK